MVEFLMLNYRTPSDLEIVEITKFDGDNSASISLLLQRFKYRSKFVNLKQGTCQR